VTCDCGADMKRKRPTPSLTHKDAATLKRIAQAGGLTITHRGPRAAVQYTLHNSDEDVPAQTVKRLVEAP
jgi:hypothetical protein